MMDDPSLLFHQQLNLLVKISTLRTTSPFLANSQPDNISHDSSQTTFDHTSASDSSHSSSSSSAPLSPSHLEEQEDVVELDTSIGGVEEREEFGESVKGGTEDDLLTAERDSQSEAEGRVALESAATS